MSDETEIGTIKFGRDIGRVDLSANWRFVWVRCPSCETERWVRYEEMFNSVPRYCKPCAIAWQNKNRNHGTKTDSV